MSLPSSVGLPNEMMLGHLDYSIPPDAKSFSVKVQPSNLSQIQTSFTAASASQNLGDLVFLSQNIIFDLPSGASPSMFLDSRFTTLNFSANFAITNAGTSSTFADSYLRSGAYAWFDRMYITSQNGQIIEDIGEFGLLNDTLISLQMNNSVRDGVSNQYGFEAGTGNTSQGHKIAVLSSNVAAVTTSNGTHSYSILFPLPLLVSLLISS